MKKLNDILLEIPEYIEDLECDGATKVIHYILDKNNISHRVMIGNVLAPNDTIPLHYWIELANGYIIDFKARMWLGNNAPNGMFNPITKPKYIYKGKPTNINVTDFIFLILTGIEYG